MPTASRYPRETVEFVPFEVTVDGLPPEGDVQYALCRTRERPTEWATAQRLEGRTGFLLDGLDLGLWHIWTRVVDEPEAPVVHAGVFEVV